MGHIFLGFLMTLKKSSCPLTFGAIILNLIRIKFKFNLLQAGDVNYENKEDCDWIIEATPGRNVHLRSS